ncbi:MAG: hypothetical protein H7Y12_15130 [Sphingobacteriaceae bacterium]|nr:hypothetical protein [Cytophagaceae bacterium]
MTRAKQGIVFGLLLTAAFGLSSCWAPRCPEKSCHVRIEHRHGGMAYRGRSIFASPVHGFGFAAKNRSGDADEKSAFKKNKDPKTKKKFKKLLPWEKV